MFFAIIISSAISAYSNFGFFGHLFSMEFLIATRSREVTKDLIINFAFILF